MLQKLTTNKLFYSKWPYKVTCIVEGAHLLRSYTVESILDGNFRNYKNISLLKLKNFLKLAEIYLSNKSIKKRIEGSRISFYFLNDNDFINFYNNLNDFVISITEPLNFQELEKLKINSNYTLCSNLPHKKYKFKISFKDMPLKIRQNLINWAEKYNNEEIYITKSTKRHFSGIKYHYGTHYFYVKDQKMITFIQLAAAGYIRKIDEYVIREFSEEV